jgi:hypothetical protein
MCRRIALFALVLAVCGCSRGRPPAGGPPREQPPGAGPQAEADRFDIYEAVFRHQMRVEEPQPVFYLGIGSEDPPAAFLQRFRDQPARVQPLSAFGEKAQESRALLLHVHEEILWVNADRARVLVKYSDPQEPENCGTPFPEVVERRSGRWAVVPARE